MSGQNERVLRADADSNLSEVEHIKESSRGLRGALLEELATETTHFTDESRQLVKFHGSYEQEDRDQRKERKKEGLEPAYQFMVRSKLPGGVLTAEQYLAHDDIATRLGSGTLRVTTRQDFQVHGILKKHLRDTIRELNQALVTTFGACGDVNRNVITCPAPLPGRLRPAALEVARTLSSRLLPRTGAYHEIWLDGERWEEADVAAAEPETGVRSVHAGGDVASAGPPEADPIYGENYLPRKFKIAIAFPDDNCTDVYANDLGLVAVAEGDRLYGFNLLVGGGLGQTHGKEETYPRLASPLGYAPASEILQVAEAVVAVQREHGNRSNRRRARLKYLLDERGVDWFRYEVEQRLGHRLSPPAEVAVHAAHDHLGWNEQGEGLSFYGLFIENGRIKDTPDTRLRTALRTVVERLRLVVHLTPQQNLLLVGITDGQRREVERILDDHGVERPESVEPVRRWSMACPALPTCGLAVAESERALPAIVRELHAELTRLGLEREAITVRMTGCPNGCARPYNAEIAFVGRSLGKYVVYLGGNPEGTQLADAYADLVPLDRLVATIRPVLERFRADRLPGESFGRFWQREKDRLPAYVPAERPRPARAQPEAAPMSEASATVARPGPRPTRSGGGRMSAQARLLEDGAPGRQLPDAADATHLLAGAGVEEILRWGIAAFQPGRLALVSAFGPGSAVLIHHLARLDVRLPVIFIDTLHHFPETLQHVIRVGRRYDLDLRIFRPAESRAAFEAVHGPELWQRDLSAYQQTTKVEPFRRATAGLDAWITGRRRDQSESRTHLPVVEGGLQLRVNPLAAWTRTDVWRFILEHDLPYNPLHDRGYASIGDEPLTSPAGANEPERAGRWRGSGRLECGIHEIQGGS